MGKKKHTPAEEEQPIAAAEEAVDTVSEEESAPASVSAEEFEALKQEYETQKDQFLRMAADSPCQQPAHDK